MAGLTRTQKYANLRAQLNNDGESQTVTEDLNRYRDKLKGFEDSFNKELDDTLAKIREKSLMEEAPSFDNANRQFVNPVKKDEPYIDFLSSLDSNSLDKRINDVITANTEPAKVVTPAVETPVAPVTPVSVISADRPVFVETPAVAPQVNPVPADTTIRNIEGEFNNIINDLNAQTAPAPQPVRVEVPSPAPAVNPETVSVQPEAVSRPAEVNTEYVNDTLKEVADYNRNEGNKTIEEIPAAVVDAVRHPESVNREESDDEFTNTVTLEIDKVLNEVRNPEEETEARAVAEEPEKAVIEEPVKEEETFEHPVLTKTAEEEKPVEILPLNETLKMDVIDDTIPFVAEKENEIEEADEEEDSGFSKIINVILVILIVVLIAILGVIVYYILYAKGIIG